jgi:carbon monoxide dehydrogenase subunit G
MELNNTFTVPVPVDEAWRVMLDVARFAPCMPGATVDQVQGDDVLGRVRVKLGPISITYQGKVTFVEKDEEKHRVVLSAAARETRGSGTASARVTAALNDVGGATEVSVSTDLNITGKPAQFGRGVMSDVSERIMGEFAENLARELDSGPLGKVAEPRRASAGSLDLLDAAGAPVLKRLAPVVAALLALLGVVLVRRAMRGRS